jgi:spore coat-associated protein N
MTAKARTIASNPTARKVVGSLGIIGAAAAVAGMGTFGSFTDSTTPVATTVNSGTVSIDMTQPGFAIPVSTSNFVPGDSLTRSINLVNDGGSPLGSVGFASTATVPSVLTTDAVNGLQLAVKECSVPWTQGGTTSAATYTCSGTTTTLASGPAVSSLTLPSAKALAAGGTDYLTVSISLPVTADNTFQGKSATLSLVFTGTQATGTAR